MVTKWGMSDAIGPVALESDSQSPYVQQNDHVARLIAEEVKKIIDTSLKTAEDTLKKNREALESVVEGLLDKETLEQEDYDTIIRKHGIEPKKKPVKETKK